MKKGREKGLWGCGDQIQSGESPGSPPRAGPGGAAAPGGGSSGRARGRGAGAVPGGVPEGRGGRGLRGHPSALPPVLRPHPLRGCGAVLQGSCGGQRSCPWLGVPGGMHMDGVPTRARVGPAVPSSRAPAPSRSSSMAGNSRLRWRRALPEILVRAGAVNSIFSLLAVTAGPCESPALSVSSFRCSWIVHFPTPLHPALTEPPEGSLGAAWGSAR